MRLVLLGPPGAGKGTQAVLLKEKLQVPHISTGDIFRKKIKDGSELGETAKSFVDKGELVPDEIVVAMVRERLEEDDTKGGFILDGFPRTRAQAEALSVTLKELGIALDYALDFQTDEELIIFRLKGRRVCKKCGHTYHAVNHPPKVEGVCDECGGEVIHRKDDEEETVRNRLKIYYETANPLLDYYKEQGLLYVLDSAKGYDAIDEELDELFQKSKN